MHEPALRLEHDHARAFAADQRLRDVEAVLRQERVEVVAGNAARDLRVLRSDLIRETIAQRLEPRIDLAAPPAPSNDRLELVVAGRPNAHAHAVVREDLQLVDVVDGLAGHERVHAARVVADHSAERAAAVRRGVGAEREVVLLSGIAQVIEDDARLHPREAQCGIHLRDVVHVLREVEYDGDVAALSRKGCPSTAGKDWGAVLARQGHGGDDVVRAAREHDADGNLPVVGSVGRVESARPVVEPNLTLDDAPQLGGQRLGIDVHALDTVGVIDALTHRASILERHGRKALDVHLQFSLSRGFL